MNANPYPQGRWTSSKLNEANPIRTSFVDTTRRLDRARLSELFWATSESPMLSDARQRIERLVLGAVSDFASENQPPAAAVVEHLDTANAA